MVTQVKLYSKENLSIRITDFKLLNVSIYGCDARFDYEIRDQDTDILLDTDCDVIRSAFMGIDDSEELDYFLEEKGIDLSTDYDDDYDKLPESLRKEFEQYQLEMYDDQFHEYFFGEESIAQEDIIAKLKDELSLYKGDIYVIQDEKVSWISISSDYFGKHLKSDEIVLQTVYNMDTEGWIYDIDGIYFEVYGSNGNYSLQFYIRADESRYIVKQEDIDNYYFPDYDGRAGDVLYSYYSED